MTRRRRSHEIAQRLRKSLYDSRSTRKVRSSDNTRISQTPDDVGVNITAEQGQSSEKASANTELANLCGNEEGIA